MEPVPGHTDIYQAPGPEGELLGRRIAGAWLVVEKGQGLQQRLGFLEHLRVELEL
jgi:hypothetical protein